MRSSPKKVFFRARRVNAATSTIPTPVIQTAIGYAFHAPMRIVISAANPLKPGNAHRRRRRDDKGESGERHRAAKIHPR